MTRIDRARKRVTDAIDEGLRDLPADQHAEFLDRCDDVVQRRIDDLRTSDDHQHDEGFDPYDGTDL